MSSAWPIALVVLAVIGFLVWFSRSQQRSAILAFREAEIRRIDKIHEEGKKIDAQTEKVLEEVVHPAFDSRAMWLRDQKRIPDLSKPPAPGNTV